MNKRMTILLATTFIFISVFLISSPADSTFAATKAKVNIDYLNVREQPTSDSKKIGLLKKGTEVTITEEQAGWTKFPYGTTYGWVSSKYLLKNPVMVKAVKEGYVSVSSLNLRDSANPSSLKLATLKKGDIVQIKSSSGNWLEVYVPSIKKDGWVSQSYITVGKPVPSTTGTSGTTVKKTTTYYVTANSLNIRKEPNPTSVKLLTAKKNDKLVGSAVNGSWVKVTTETGLIGWASLAYLTNSAPTNGLTNKVIVIDAGHGGKDPGASGATYQEKTLTLNLAKELKRSLQAAGTKVIMTRDGDTYPSLSQRVNVSHANNADAFISIHLNSSSSGTAHGIETYYYSTNVNERLLASYIQEEVIKATGLSSRGIAEGNFQVIRTNKKAAILVELGFISNVNEEQIIASKDYQVQAATGIVKGLERYFNQ